MNRVLADDGGCSTQVWGKETDLEAEVIISPRAETAEEKEPPIVQDCNSFPRACGIHVADLEKH